jgi:Mg2+-importing ATPase
MLQANGHTVGFLGDGINDAAALRDADVGISVDTAADIARESADIILLEKSLLVLESGIVQGRQTFGNIIKYLKMTASSNFGNVFSVLVASTFLPFLPMLPLHLMILDLLYHVSQLSIPWDRLDKDYLEKPRKWEAGDIARFMIFVGPASSVFDITTFCLMWFVFGANSPDQQSLFQSGWFVESLLSQTLIVHMIRTRKIPFVQSAAALPVLLLTAAVIVIGILIPFSPLGASVGLQPLPVSYFPWLVATLIAYCALTQLIKSLYINRFSKWL